MINSGFKSLIHINKNWIHLDILKQLQREWFLGLKEIFDAITPGRTATQPYLAKPSDEKDEKAHDRITDYFLPKPIKEDVLLIFDDMIDASKDNELFRDWLSQWKISLATHETENDFPDLISQFFKEVKVELGKHADTLRRYDWSTEKLGPMRHLLGQKWLWQFYNETKDSPLRFSALKAQEPVAAPADKKKSP